MYLESKSASPIPAHNFAEGQFASARVEQIKHDMLRGMCGRNGINVIPNRNGFVIEGSYGRGLFEIKKVSAANITIGDGYIQTATAFLYVAEQIVAVGGTPTEPHFIVVEGDQSSASIAAHSFECESFAGHTDAQFRRPLWQVYLGAGGGAIVLRDMRQLIDLKTWFNP